MKLSKIVNAVPALTRLAGKELPLATSYKLSIMLKALQADLDFHNDQRLKIAQKYGNLNEDGSAYIISPENTEAAQNEIDTLLELDVQADAVPVSICADEDVSLSANDIGLLDGFVVFTAES